MKNQTFRKHKALARLDAAPPNYVRAAGLMDIAGVIAGIKPVVLMHTSEVSIKEVKTLGFHCVVVNETGSYIASNDRTRAIEAARIFTQGLTKSGNRTVATERKIGKLLGYPATATEYFLKRWKTLDTKDELPVVIPRSTLGTVDDFFVQLILSPEHYKEELAAYVMPLKEATRQYLPKTYRYLEKDAIRERRRTAVRRLLVKLKLRKPPVATITKLYVD